MGGYDGRFAVILGADYGTLGEDGEEVILDEPLILEIIEVTEEESESYE
jgi:hypothetical protein